MRNKYQCVVCGLELPGTPFTSGQCTNGACRACHNRHCTGGGITYPGHNLTVPRKYPHRSISEDGTVAK